MGVMPSFKEMSLRVLMIRDVMLMGESFRGAVAEALVIFVSSQETMRILSQDVRWGSNEIGRLCHG